MYHFSLICLMAAVLLAILQAPECLTRSASATTSTSTSEVIEPSSKNETENEGDAVVPDGIENLINSLDSNSLTIKQVEHASELDVWEAPYEMRKAYSYYLSGFDEENRPVWASEVGKWNFRLVTDGGPDKEKVFEKYLQQLAHRLIKSVKDRSTEDEPVDGVVVILDMEGFDIVKMSHLPTVSLLLRMLVKFLNIVDTYLHSAVVINTAAAAQGIFNLARPILGPIFQRAEIYGTNRAKWVPQLLKQVPKTSLPKWYGGKADFKPIIVYG